LSVGLLEITLRFFFGFCDSVLVLEDPDVEYIAQPNQHRVRFGNRIDYNSNSMRSNEVDTSAWIILGFGDSVINGGTQTDQSELATTLLTDILSKLMGKKVQFLNISAGSWGPDNCYAYLRSRGDFKAKDIYLFVSSHDAYDNMSFEKIVDKNVSFPSRQYKLAIGEFLDRYVGPRLKAFMGGKAQGVDALGINKKKKTSAFNSGFLSFFNYAEEHKLPFRIFLHAERQELNRGEYNEQGKAIIQFAKEHEIPIILDLQNGLSIIHLRDDIHIDAKGQQLVVKLVIEDRKIKSLLK